MTKNPKTRLQRDLDINTHHVLFCRTTWNRGPYKVLRDSPALKITLDCQAHKLLHEKLKNLPELSMSWTERLLQSYLYFEYERARSVYQDYCAGGIDSLIYSLNSIKILCQSQLSDLESDQIDLMVRHLTRQKGFVIVSEIILLRRAIALEAVRGCHCYIDDSHYTFYQRLLTEYNDMDFLLDAYNSINLDKPFRELLDSILYPSFGIQNDKEEK